MGEGIRLVREPSVYLVGRQSVGDEALNRFLSDHGVAWESDSEVAAEVLTEAAGRVCYMSFAKPRPGGNAAYLQHILESGHGSVLEHAVFSLVISGVSRSLTHELVRHRAGFAYSQLSQRYVDESDCAFVVPPELQREVEAAEKRFRESWYSPQFSLEECACMLNESDPDYHLTAEERAGVLWIQAVRQAQDAYRELTAYLAERLMPAAMERERAANFPDGGMNWSDNREVKTAVRKAARQAARSVLPNATETRIFVTGNARALRHFLEMRGSRHAEAEIRRLAFKVWRLLHHEAPHLFGDYSWSQLPDGTMEVSTPWRKV